MGSGNLEKSQVDQKLYMNIDVGGGTSNIGVGTKGQVGGTSCINIGGRLLGIEKDLNILRIDQPTYRVMDHF